MMDPLDDLLTPTPSPPDESLRQQLFARTARVLRWRRRSRQLGTVGLALATCAAGLLLVLGPFPPEEPTALPRAVVKAEVPPPPEEPTSPVALEWRALEHPDEAVRHYTAAADGYLQVGDTTNAMRCYGNALDEGGSAALEANTNDTWLFLAIKQARKKERDGCVE
jgi:hypothetical protein